MKDIMKDIINDIIDFMKITPFEKTILTKMSYKFNLSKEEKRKLVFLIEKIFCYKMLKIYER